MCEMWYDLIETSSSCFIQKKKTDEKILFRIDYNSREMKPDLKRNKQAYVWLYSTKTSESSSSV